jgi:tetratricopeptide (TPR) repeat protein
LHFAHDFRAAETAFRRAIELQPSNAQVRHDYAHYLLAVGRTAESAAESIRAAELDPASGMLHACVGWHRFTDGHYQAAITGATNAIAKSPRMGWPKVILAWAHQQTHNHDKAIESLRAAVAATDGKPFFRAQLAHGLAVGGARAEAVQILNDLTSLQPPAYSAAYDIAVIYAGLGDADRAFAWLEKARAERSTFLVFIGWDPRFNSLRTDTRYAKLIRDIGLPNAPQS